MSASTLAAATSPAGVDQEEEDDSVGIEDPVPPSPLVLDNDGEATLYKYRDFANVPEDQEAPNDDAASQTPTSANPNQLNRSLESSIRVQKFPVKLYAILAQREFADIVTWMPHGRSWKVLKPNLFESLVMPLFFEYSNYHSFNRLVNAWSFRRISSGPDRGSYYHELFLRGRPHLQKYMRRLPKTHKKLPMKKQDEPDFYKLDKTSPLPEIEQTVGGSYQGAGGSNGASGMQNLITLQQQQHHLQQQQQQQQQQHHHHQQPQQFSQHHQVQVQVQAQQPLQQQQRMNPLVHPYATTGVHSLNQHGQAPLGSAGATGPFLKEHQSPSTSSALNNPLMNNMLGPDFPLQRLRHLQHIQLFQRQIGAASLAGTDDIARIQAEHALGIRGNSNGGNTSPMRPNGM